MPATKDKSRVTELRDALQNKANEIQEISNSFKDETGNGHFVISNEQHDAYKTAINEAEQIKELLASEEKADGIFEFLEQPADGDGSAAADDAATHARQGMSSKALSDAFLDSEAYQEMKDSGFRRFGQTFATDSGIPELRRAAEHKDVYSAMGGEISIPALGRTQDLGLTERQLRPGRVRDLFPAESTNASLLYGIRETGFTNRARTVAERYASDGTSPPTGTDTDVYGLKPRSELSIVPVTYPISTIAHIMYAHRNTLDDEPRLRGLIDRDMIDGVKMAEDEQVLYGDGVGENITGIFNTSGIQTYTGLSTDKYSAQVRRAMTRAILAYFQPTGVVVHPLDWEELELEQTTDGHYRIAMSVAVGGEKRMWRLNVVDTPAINEGQFLLGAFGQAARLYDREQTSIQVSTENRDMFERNVVTLRCEERVALEVPRPEAMVAGTLTTPA